MTTRGCVRAQLLDQPRYIRNVFMIVEGRPRYIRNIFMIVEGRPGENATKESCKSKEMWDT